MGKRRPHEYPTPPRPLGSFALRRYRAILDRVEVWSAINIDRASHLATLEVKSSTGLEPWQHDDVRRHKAALGLTDGEKAGV